jgi:hypothetical protein
MIIGRVEHWNMYGPGNTAVTLEGLTIAAVNESKTEYGVGLPAGSGAIVRNCIIYGFLHGLHCCTCWKMIVENCIIHDCTLGMDIDADYGVPEIFMFRNSLVYDCYAGMAAGGEGLQAGVVAVQNITFVRNRDYGAVGFYGYPILKNCIVWDCNDDLKSCIATYSCIQDGDSGTGNISSNPCFVDADANDFHLDVNSPCIDVGDPNGNYSGQKDIDGDDCVIDISGKGDGVNDVDMGADEYNDD